MRSTCSLVLLFTLLAGSAGSDQRRNQILEGDKPYGPSNIAIAGPDEITVGVPYAFLCSAQCSPTCSYTWTTDGKVTDGPELDILLKSLVEPKVVTCTARNVASGMSATTTRTLAVTEGPSNVAIAGPDIMLAGGSAKFVCSADCYPTCVFSWRVDGQLQDWHSGEIDISAEDWMISQTLTCTAQNSISGLFAAATKTVTVADGPSSLQIIGPDEAKTGTMCTYVCLSYCAPSCTFSWTVNGQTKYGDIINIIVQGSMNSEQLECKAENTLSGSVMTTNMTITVTDSVSVRPVSVLPPTASKPFSLRCVGSSSEASVQWYENNAPVASGGRVTLSADGTVLSFSPLLKSDTGFYQCVASEGNDVIRSLGYQMNVNYGPVQASVVELNHGPIGQELSLALGADITLQCLSQCYPTCNYTWVLNALVVQGNSISLTPVTMANSGYLVCLVYSAVTGLYTSVATIVTVTPPGGPSNLRISGPDTVEAGVPFRFACSADCAPSCNYTWTINGKALFGSEVDVTVERRAGSSRTETSEVLMCQAQNTATGSFAPVEKTLRVTVTVG